MKEIENLVKRSIQNVSIPSSDFFLANCGFLSLINA